MAYRDDRESEILRLRAENENLVSKLTKLEKTSKQEQQHRTVVGPAPDLNSTPTLAGVADALRERERHEQIKLAIRAGQQRREELEKARKSFSAEDRNEWLGIFQAILSTSDHKDDVDWIASRADLALVEFKKRFQ